MLVMGGRLWTVCARTGVRRKTIEIFLSYWDKDRGKGEYVKGVELGEMDLEHEPLDWNPILIDVGLAQSLMDELWHCGIRPTEGNGSAGQAAATDRHLTDMQKLSWELLELIKKGIE